MAEKKELDYNDNQEMVKFIDEHLFKAACKWKFYYAGDNHNAWLDDLRFYKGKQWGKKPAEKSSIFFNRLFSTIQKELPFMTDRLPKMTIDPAEPSDQLAADMIQKITENSWIDRNMEIKLPEGVMHAKTLGTAFFMPFWNPELLDGLGDVDCKVLDPLEVFPLAYSKPFENRWQGYIWARWVSLGDIRRSYPDTGGLIKAEKTETNLVVPDRAKDTNSGGGMEYSQVTDTTGARTDYLPSPTGSSIDSTDMERVLLKTLWIRDGSVEEIEEEDKKGKVEKKMRAMYPLGRMVTFANGVILEDAQYQYKFAPIIEMPNYINPSEYWGMSDITQIKEGQKELNKINAMIIDAMRRDVYRQKFILEQSGIEADDYQVTSDSVYFTRVANPVQEVGQFSLPAPVFNYPEFIEKGIQTTAGTSEYTAPTGGNLPSGRAFQEFQEVTQTRIRQKIRNMDYAIRMIGRAWVEMILKNYTEKRIMRLMNSNTGKSEFVYIYKEENPEKAAIIEEQIKQQIDPATGQPLYKNLLNMAYIKSDLDLRIMSGSTVAVSRMGNVDMALQLFDRQTIDQKALLEAADFPNRDEIVERMAQQAQAQQQAMAQQQQVQQQQDIQKEVAMKAIDHQSKAALTTSKAIKVAGR